MPPTELSACGGTKERPIQYIYLALGASDATGVGALPSTEGNVYLIARKFDRQLHGVFLVNLGVPRSDRSHQRASPRGEAARDESRPGDALDGCQRPRGNPSAASVLVDLHASPVRDDLVFDVDGFHPNNTGHREISRQFLQVILPKVHRR